jgi:hypothetical protein
MKRTFVLVELVVQDDQPSTRFSTAMDELGFVRIIKGRKTGKALRLPEGMYLIERANAEQALGLTRQAARAADVEARIFCVPAGEPVRFGHLEEVEVEAVEAEDVEAPAA